MGFEKLESFVELTVEYEAKSALAIHAGKGAPFEAVESPVIKSAGKPIIPGSSLKGALRSTLEAILADAGERVCVPLAAIPDQYRRRDEQEAYARRIGRKIACSVDDLCPVCQIFGTTAAKQGLSGRALFLDARPVGDYTLVERTHVAIARDTKSQAGGKLMTLQAVDAGAVFEGTIRIINPEDWQVGALLRALEGVELLGLGAKKTAGYGEIAIRVKAIQTRELGKEGWEVNPVTPEPYRQAFDRKFLQ
jgi:CRISPR-associated RAMP protein (TIGR02581 family)